MINRAGSLSSNTHGFISCWNHLKMKHQIYKTLNIFFFFFFASISSKLIFKSPAKVTSLCEISRFERESFQSNFLVLCDHSLVNNNLDLARYFSIFVFSFCTQTLKCFRIYLEVFKNIQRPWNLPGGIF